MSAPTDYAYVSDKHLQQLPAPSTNRGVVGWIMANLFSSPRDILLTILIALVLFSLLPPLIDWAFVNGVWTASSLTECREINNALGGCWAVVNERFNQFLYGFYPQDQYWRPNLTFVLLFVALAPLLFDQIPHRGRFLIFSGLYPIIAFFLIMGSETLGLEPVETSKFGGFLLTMIIGVVGISISLPIGILLALGRKSDLIIIKSICVGFIEFIRGVPLITLLFVASTLLNYFLPPGTSFDLLLRVLIMVTLFASAYMAEVIRGGLAALPQGQYEAADALGLSYWKSMRLIVLPQALKISIPGIVNTFIGLFKDTTLVLIIGMFDLLGLTNPIRANAAWNGIVWELYLFVAIFFFICCFGMSRYSMYLERKLQAGDRR